MPFHDSYLRAFANIEFGVVQKQLVKFVFTTLQCVHQRSHSQVVLGVDVHVMEVVSNPQSNQRVKPLLASDVKHCLTSL